jgi:hypothetical protein
MIRTLTFIALSAISSSAVADSRSAPRWQNAVSSAMAEADPRGGWQRVAVQRHKPNAKPRAAIVIEKRRDGSTSARYSGNVTLKRGIVAAASPDGAHALLLAKDVLVCDWQVGCKPYEGILPDEIDFKGDQESCVGPVCGGDIGVLVGASPVYLAADVVTRRDGSKTYAVKGLIVGFDNALRGIEPDEID